MTALERIARKLAEALRPPPEMKLWEYADAFRIVPSEASSEPGRWCTDRTPYLREIMECLSDSDPTRKVVLMKGAQLGATELGINWMMYIAELYPGPTLVCQPTIDMAKRFSKQRVGPSIRMMPKLARTVAQNKSRGKSNTMMMKEFPGGLWIFGGANSAASLASMPIKYLFGDEIDRWPPDVDNEGSPLKLVEQRTTNFPNRKIYFCSTPTISGLSAIEKEYLESDRREYEVPCPFCGAFQVLQWDLVRCDRTEDGHDMPSTAYYQCAECGARIEEGHKTRMLELGRWVKRNPDSHVAGFWISSLYSPVGWLSWADMVRDAAAAAGNPQELQVFRNTKLGLPWEETGDDLEWQPLLERREDYGDDTDVPEGGLVLICTVDVQMDRLECQTIAWGRAREHWVVDYTVLPGNTQQNQVWQDLDSYRRKPRRHALGQQMTIAYTAIDCGYIQHIVLRYCRAHEAERVYAVKGYAGMHRPVVTRPKRDRTEKAYVFDLGVDNAKRMALGYLQNTEEGLPRCHFPKSVGAPYFQMLTAERMEKAVKNRKIVAVWGCKKGRRNEAWDTYCYNIAMHEFFSAQLNWDMLEKWYRGEAQPMVKGTARHRIHK